MPLDPLPQYLRMYRKRSGLSQQELAYLLGATTGSKVSRYELGRRLPSFATVLAYEIAFRVALDALYAGTHQAAWKRLRQRAARLSRKLDAMPFTPRIKQKLDFLVELINQPKRRHEDGDA